MGRNLWSDDAMKKTVTALSLAAMLAGCVQPLAEYTPVADTTNPAKFNSDLAQCRVVATRAEGEYAKRQEADMGANILTGLLVGALIGGAIGGGDYVGYGAANGALAGAASTDTELAHGGPRRIIDRCMVGRGHKVLNDIGRG
jgi:outer membrane lipoprotein SlyB